MSHTQDLFQAAEEEDEVLQFEKKTINPVSDSAPQVPEANFGDSPYKDVLKGRSEERRRTMKEHNHKFGTKRSIEEIEKVPAYKRQGVDLNDTDTSRKFQEQL